MKTRELCLAGFVLAAFGASIGACSAQGTTAAPDLPDNLGSTAGQASMAGAPTTPVGAAGSTPVGAAGAQHNTAGAPAQGGAPAKGGSTGTTFGGAPPAAGATGLAGATGVAGCSTVAGTLTDLSIDDFEDGEGSIQPIGGRRGFWYTFNDGTAKQVPTSSTASPFLPVAGGHATTSKFMAETSGPAFTMWGAGIGFDINKTGDYPCPYNASAYTGIKFWAKSTAALKAMVQIPATTAKQATADNATCVSATTCNDHYYIPVTATTAWTQYTIAFADTVTFKQEGWGTKVATFDKAHILGMQFQVGKALAFDFSLDDITFY